MKLEQGKISGGELTLLMIGFILGSTVLISPGAAAAQQGWMAILLGMMEAMAFAYLYIILLRRFSGRTPVEIHELVFGPWLGKLVSLAFLGYFFHVGSLGVTFYHDYLKMGILVETPSSVVIFAGIMIIIYGAVKGIEVLARCSQGMVIMTLFLLLILTLLTIPNIELSNLLPLFSLPLGKLLWSAHGAATFPFGETVAFMMVAPSLNRSNQTTVVFLKAIVIGGFFLMVVSARTVAVLGKTAEIFIYPGFEASRLIQIADVFTRLELIPAINFLMMVFLKTSVLLYVTALGLGQLFKLKRYQPLVLPLGLLMGLTSLLNFSNVLESITFLNRIYPLYGLCFQLLIPAITLIVAFLRKQPREG